MYLTDKDKLSPRQSSEHEEIELLLEHVSTQVEEVVSEAEGLVASYNPSGLSVRSANN